MDYQLLVVRGRSASGTIKLEDGVTIVGRHDDCHLKIKSSQVSRQHCHLFEKKGLLLVKDLGSANGTYVNGKRVKEQQVLEPGDELTIGDVQLRVAKIGQDLAATPTPPPAKKDLAATPPPRPNAKADTAISKVDPVAIEVDDYEIDFGDSSTEVQVSEPAAKADPKSETRTGAEADSKKKGASEPGPDPLIGDDAVADFLSTIQLDEEE